MYSTDLSRLQTVCFVPMAVLRRIDELGLKPEVLMCFDQSSRFLSNDQLTEIVALNELIFEDVLSKTKNFTGLTGTMWEAQLPGKQHLIETNGVFGIGDLPDEKIEHLQKLLSNYALQRDKHFNSLRKEYGTDNDISLTDANEKPFTIRDSGPFQLVVGLEPQTLNLSLLTNLAKGKENGIAKESLTYQLLKDLVKTFYVYHTPSRIASTGWFKLYLQAL